MQEMMRVKFDPNELTTSIDSMDVKQYLQDILTEKFGNSPKSVIDEYEDRWNFSCPDCGDSTTDNMKKRGNMYLNDYHVHCYNCGGHWTLQGFLREFDRDVRPGAIKKFVNEQIERNGSHGRRRSNSMNELLGDDVLEHAIDRTFLIESLHLTEISEYPKGAGYLRSRCQYDNHHFAWDVRRNRLYIFNLDGLGEKVLGYQVRTFRNSGPKYLTYEMSAMYRELGMTLDDEVAKRLDPLSTSFGCLTVNLNERITIFEGPLDSFLMRNSIALCSLNRKPPFMTQDMRFLFDYDNVAREKSREYLKSGMTVFMWKKFLEDNIPEWLIKSKVDFTDVNIYAMNHNLKFDYDSYFTNQAVRALWI